MSGEGGSVDDKTVAEVTVSMRRLLAAINAGELDVPTGEPSPAGGCVGGVGGAKHPSANERFRTAAE